MLHGTRNTTLTVRDSLFINNFASFRGGAIYTDMEFAATLTLLHTRFINNTSTDGGTLATWNAVVIVHNCQFIHNRARVGAAAYMGTTTLSVHNCDFINNTGKIGGALTGNTLTITVNHSRFVHNTARIGSSLTLIDNTTLLVLGSHFVNNTGRELGGVIYLNHTVSDIRHSQFVNNSAGYFGGAVIMRHTTMSLDQSVFLKNSAIRGSCLDIKNSLLVVNNSQFVGNTAKSGTLFSLDATVSLFDVQFINNTASFGGALNVDLRTVLTITSCQLSGNTALVGGAIYILQQRITVTFYKSRFTNNTAKYTGGAVHAVASDLLIRNCRFNDNSATDLGGAIHAANCSLLMQNGKIQKNRASKGGALYVIDSHIHANLTADLTIAHNTAEYGGALYFINSEITLTDNLNFSSNAAGKGGAIYVQDSDCEEVLYPAQNTSCFLHAEGSQLFFLNNSADEGSVLYGGLLDRCEADDGQLGIEYVKNVSLYEPTPLAITSDPVRVCLCTDDNEIICAARGLNLTKIRGEAINLTVTGVDQAQNPKESIIRARSSNDNVELGIGETLTRVVSNCSRVSFHLFETSNTSVSTNFVIQPDEPCQQSPFSSVTVQITLTPCPRGLEQNYNRCECERRLKDFVASCTIGNSTIRPEGSTWLRYDEEYLRVHRHCPLDYCQVTNTISIEYPDEQCMNHRSGVICGACQDNHSIVLGSSRCLRCSSSYAFTWLIPVFAVAGIALVTLLLVCDMTISHGTLNGLIFYANVISISELTSLQTPVD